MYCVSVHHQDSSEYLFSIQFTICSNLHEREEVSQIFHGERGTIYFLKQVRKQSQIIIQLFLHVLCSCEKEMISGIIFMQRFNHLTPSCRLVHHQATLWSKIVPWWKHFIQIKVKPCFRFHSQLFSLFLLLLQELLN